MVKGDYSVSEETPLLGVSNNKSSIMRLLFVIIVWQIISFFLALIGVVATELTNKLIFNIYSFNLGYILFCYNIEVGIVLQY